MSSRLHRIGTIYSRIDGFIRKGRIREVDKPIWFDVYTHFPPLYQPYYGRPAPSIKITNILYPEDVARSKIHKALGRRLGVVDLSNNSEVSKSKKMLNSYEELISKGVPEEEALERLKVIYKDLLDNTLDIKYK